MNPARAAGLFAKPPVAGSVKTRLSPPLTEEGAAELYRAFLADQAAMLAGGPWSWTVFSTDATMQERMWPEDAPRPAAFRPQRGEDLGARLAAAFADLFTSGAQAAVVIGSDHPTLPAAAIAEALDALAHRDVVLGPTFDGGYYLVGMSRLHAALFEGIPWSTPEAFAATLDRIEAAGLAVAVLPPWHDVDTPEDLRFLADHLRALRMAGRQDAAPATAAALERLGLLPSTGRRTGPEDSTRFNPPTS